ncbi:Aste57867_19732 [Aphanomyces stellatus]|uniref:Aste57867_19732 protein n=1 Tax=Aphanomyces stellatus TaxID=120398 RepID=A0A485LD93_9STRA|nr:hypothetical protein As57867_019667 [Aphanomyces stellatus]VFT96430.1 Aste57867_19732 [Aphanomyces stellatus]
MWRQVMRAAKRPAGHRLPLVRQMPCMKANPLRLSHVRLFSSNSPDESTRPSTFQKALDDKDRFIAWDTADVFSPDMFAVKKMMLFAMLHQAFPEKAAFDIPDFLSGAKDALDLVLRTVYSPAFLAAVVDPSIENDEIQLLREIMTSDCLEMLVQGFKVHHDNGCTAFDLSKLEINGAYLDNVKIAEDLSSILLYVKFDTAEHVTVTGTKDGAVISESSVREAESNWIFESPVPENLSWTIVRM